MAYLLIIILILFIGARFIVVVRKARERLILSRVPLQELQARASAFREQTKHVHTDLDYFGDGLGSSTIFGVNSEALFEAMLNKTFTSTSTTDFHSNHSILVTHYCWQLNVLKIVLEDWGHPYAIPTPTGYLLEEASATTLNATLSWLSYLAKKHSSFARRFGLSNAISLWNANLFEYEHIPNPSGRRGSTEVHCDPAKLQAEIDKLSN